LAICIEGKAAIGPTGAVSKTGRYNKASARAYGEKDAVLTVGFHLVALGHMQLPLRAGRRRQRQFNKSVSVSRIRHPPATAGDKLQCPAIATVRDGISVNDENPTIE
jgi:hypothetical protein